MHINYNLQMVRICPFGQIIFVAACDALDTFTGWWDLASLPNAPSGGRVLIVPDFDAMAALPSNSGIAVVHSQDIDLVQGTIAWETQIWFCLSNFWKPDFREVRIPTGLSKLTDL